MDIGRARLYLADCREVIALLPVGCAIVSDPQYGAGRFKSTHNSGRKGVGATKRLSAVRWGVAGNIVGAWILTFPAAGSIGALMYFLVRPLFS